MTSDPGTNVSEMPVTSSETNDSYPVEPRSLLIADDEHLVATGLSSSIQELGFSVVGPAADGEEAINLCATSHPDMALLDIRMPKKDGLAAAEVIFTQFGIPVVIFSAFSDQEYVEATVSDSAMGLLEFLPTLGVGEAVAIGEAVSMPMRMFFDRLPDNQVPESHSASFSTDWRDENETDGYLDQIINRWRKQARDIAS